MPPDSRAINSAFTLIFFLSNFIHLENQDSVLVIYLANAYLFPSLSFKTEKWWCIIPKYVSVTFQDERELWTDQTASLSQLHSANIRSEQRDQIRQGFFKLIFSLLFW